jgi:hypothetical protein
MRLWISTILVASVLVASGLISWRRGRSRPAGSAAVAETSPTAQEVDELRREVDELKLRTAPKLVLVAPGVNPAAAPEQKARERTRMTTETLESRFAGEGIDVDWSRKATQDLRAALAGRDAQTRLTGVDCATSLCKVVMEHESPEAQRELASAIGELPPFRAGVVYRYDKNGEAPRTTLYVLREGHDFREVIGAPNN